MKYHNIKEGIFVSRPNRFIAHVEIDGKVEICHVKNTGRCKELLIPGTKVYLEESSNPNRKTKYDLVQVYKGDQLVNLDSQMPNFLVKEWLENGLGFPDITLLETEKKYGNSRFDLYTEYQGKKAWIEVKGVTLENDGIARFPDAPTERGIKHIKELGKCVEDGYEAWIIFVIQMENIHEFQPNWNTHPQFGEALIEAKERGVNIRAYNCKLNKGSISICDEIVVQLQQQEEQL